MATRKGIYLSDNEIARKKAKIQKRQSRLDRRIREAEQQNLSYGEYIAKKHLKTIPKIDVSKWENRKG